MLSTLRSISQSTNLTLFHLNCSLIAALLGLATYRLFIKDWSDPNHCQALLHTGDWLDGSRHTNWQPTGCMLHTYKPKSVGQCLAGRSVVFIGDSITRVLFYGALRTMDPSVTPDGQSKHSDRTLKIGGIEWRYVWDPFLNSTTWPEIISGNYLSSLPSPTSNSKEDLALKNRPALLVVGSGLWYLGLPSGIDTWKQKVDHLFQITSPRLAHKQARIADEIVLLPVEYPAFEKLNQDRKQRMHPDQVQKMNDYTLKKSNSSPSSPIVIPTVMNLISQQAPSETQDGLHYSNKLSDIQARILFNLHCNDQILKKFPLDKTCCFQYPPPNWIQIILLLFLLVWAPLGIYINHYPNSPLAVHSYLFPSNDRLNSMAIFGGSIVLIFLSDRTSMFNKEQKQFDRLQFGTLNLLALVAGIWSAVTSEKGDMGLLNREQTDEWKGWMQIAILIYHYLAASQVSGIYNPIRICVASYLFMTGYGHFTYYYLKKDFSFPRILSVLVRLNLLTLVLAYVMDTDYLSYYFSPLVSMWFLIIWATMFIGHQWNDRMVFLLPKLACSVVLIVWFFKADKPLGWVFGFINLVFGTEWNANEWRFRVTLDMFIVYWGMLTSLIYLKVKEHKWLERDHSNRFDQLRKIAIWISALGLVWFFWFEISRPNKLIYNLYHPYISIIPISSFIILRNSTEFLRATNSKFFVFIGQCSLETFIIQFHFWLGADTKGILKVLPFRGHRLLNLIVSTVVFIFVSHQVAQASGTLSSWLCYKPKPSVSTSVGPNDGGSSLEEARAKPETSHQQPPHPGSSSVNQHDSYLPLSTNDIDKDVHLSLSDSPRSSQQPSIFLQAIDSLRNLYRSQLPFRALVWLACFWILNLLTPSKVNSHGHIRLSLSRSLSLLFLDVPN
ncbi:uncharacterized protein PGTG_12883 [Puccinia graminis f. sp. tritici CRL 75-36-700-3]|uniref:Cas1p 10 TM acyl transferase domain-containing protein n=1 Tax=Puccinia graminis f. sp. tritici (strain CRL 75-36-700-3 / race SCCL) TaxID=418459 RepID=E3KSL3_PUCGT|nr:uncharacterized protein PGTG_12883 [Puccinia graminis f. sp. tritici CRL 75-36-700-3]EFP87299.2 hypothetical protein PGTG_12883 [Puccinia graminis f. sp. tritici CRL 75-36-700-3]